MQYSKYIPLLFCMLMLNIHTTAQAQPYRWSTELSPKQEIQAKQIIDAAAPQIMAMREALQNKIQELKNFAYTSNSNHDTLATLGAELQTLRNELRNALKDLDEKLIQELGVSLHGYRGRDCSSLAREWAVKDQRLHKFSVETPHHTE